MIEEKQKGREEETRNTSGEKNGSIRRQCWTKQEGMTAEPPPMLGFKSHNNNCNNIKTIKETSPTAVYRTIQISVQLTTRAMHRSYKQTETSAK